jgi:folate-binding protein YgfZ
MSPTPLQDALRAQSGVAPRPASIKPYRGAETAADFGDPHREFAALQHACGIFDLGFRARLSLTGSDRVRWMNGMVTNNIRDLAEGHGVYAFLLNPQGRILGDMHVFHHGDSLIVETDRSQMEAILGTFDHYIIMDDVEVANLTEQQTALGVSGPTSRSLLNAVGIEVPVLQPLQMMTPRCVCDCDCVECTIIRGEDSPHESYEIWLDPKDVLKTWQALVGAGATPVGSEALEMQRVVSGVPLYGVDIRERDLPQETEQTRALNFNKGCYVGQEIVERIRSRGNVHRRFTGFLTDGAATIAPGDKVTSAEKEVGEISSVVTLSTPTGERTVALGYIRRDIGIPGREVSIGPYKSIVAPFPLEVSASERADDAMLHKV